MRTTTARIQVCLLTLLPHVSSLVQNLKIEEVKVIRLAAQMIGPAIPIIATTKSVPWALSYAGMSVINTQPDSTLHV